jgi:hypothetical protein
MSSGKGKARASHDENFDKSSFDEHQTSSIISRVAASARDLTRSATGGPSGCELHEGVVAALTNAGKGQPGSSSAHNNSTWAESSRAAQPSNYQPNISNTIKSTHDDHIRQAEAEFSSFLDGVESFMPSQNLTAHSRGNLNGDFDDVWARSQPSGGLILQEAAKPRSFGEQQRLDGEEVVNMLSSSGGIEGRFEPPQEDDEDYDWGLSHEQISQLRAMTKDLFPPVEPHMTIHRDHPFNLFPKFDHIGMGAQATAPEKYLDGKAQLVTSSSTWKEQWEDVLTGYTDEVWGNLLPLVKEARKEVGELQHNPSASEQPKALRRLGAILGHLRRH